MCSVPECAGESQMHGHELSPRAGPLAGVPEVATFAALLKHHRVARGLTQENLAERAGISARGIRALEQAERSRPHRSTVSLLADALDLSPSERAVFSVAGRRGVCAAEARTWGFPRAPRDVDLPCPLTTLIAREDEVSEILGALTAGESRLLVLIGPGGVGKTRLAIEVGWHSGERFDSVAFVPLARVSVCEQVIPAVMDALASIFH